MVRRWLIITSAKFQDKHVDEDDEALLLGGDFDEEEDDEEERSWRR